MGENYSISKPKYRHRPQSYSEGRREFKPESAAGRVDLHGAALFQPAEEYFTGENIFDLG